MAENEKKTQDTAVEAKADQKPAKVKSDKPSFAARASAWLRATKAELKKIVWTPKDAVIRNSILAIVAMAIFGLGIGLLDLAFNSAINGLAQII
ncbi:MAG: preprotein translocase subunit SecE [Clostridia bacterium]|nr:preprotein translocase subunit SecE [Clostridia bacterium]